MRDVLFGLIIGVAIGLVISVSTARVVLKNKYHSLDWPPAQFRNIDLR